MLKNKIVVWILPFWANNAIRGEFSPWDLPDLLYNRSGPLGSKNKVVVVGIFTRGPILLKIDRTIYRWRQIWSPSFFVSTRSPLISALSRRRGSRLWREPMVFGARMWGSIWYLDRRRNNWFEYAMRALPTRIRRRGMWAQLRVFCLGVDCLGVRWSS